MSKITLAKALKIKNIIIAEVASLQTKANANKVLEKDFEYFQKTNGEAAKKHKDVQKQLWSLKAAIAVANAPIYEQIYEISEIKSRISILSSLDTDARETVDLERVMVGGQLDMRKVPVKWKCFVSAEEVEAETKTLKHRLVKLQESIEEFNHKTLIDVPFLDEEFVQG